MTKEKGSKKNPIIPLILGIIGIIITPILFSPILGIGLGIVGFLLLKKEEIDEKLNKIAFITCLISLIIGVVIYVIKLF